MNFPQKRWWAGVLFFDVDWKVLLLKPTYKNDWEIPGGIIEDNKSPKECCEREILEEIGLKKQVWELLCLEYQREEDDSYMFVFDGGVLSPDEIDMMKLQESEIKSYKFCNVEKIKERVLEKMFARIGKCIEARKKSRVIYYETVNVM